MRHHAADVNPSATTPSCFDDRLLFLSVKALVRGAKKEEHLQLHVGVPLTWDRTWSWRAHLCCRDGRRSSLTTCRRGFERAVSQNYFPCHYPFCHLRSFPSRSSSTWRDCIGEEFLDNFILPLLSVTCRVSCAAQVSLLKGGLHPAAVRRRRTYNWPAAATGRARRHVTGEI